MGLATGKTFDRSVLEDVTQYLTDQYFARGKYGVRIDTHVEEEVGNRVKIKIDIKEGSRAKIREINIVGNTKFKPKEILETLELKTPNWLSWYKQDDRYSRESLQGDLEKIRNYYMDRGYANFQIDSTQVAIAPEKEDIFITVNVNEGQVYKVSEVKLAGTFVVPRGGPGAAAAHPSGADLQPQADHRLAGADAEPHGRATATRSPRSSRCRPPTTPSTPCRSPSSSTRATACTCATSPSAATTASTTRCCAARCASSRAAGCRIPRWSAPSSASRRLPYVKNVEFETTPVAGAPDLVDVNYKIEEGPASQLSGGIGYSETYKFMLNGSYADSDFLGSGQRIAVNLNGGAFSKVYNIQHTNPYTNIDNLQRTISLTYSDVTQFVSSSSTFSSQTLAFGPTWAYPITEFQYFRFGGTFNSSQLLTNTLSSAFQAQQWVRQNGHPYTRLAHDDATNNEFVFYGTNFKTFEGVVGWDWDTRNRSLFADRGMRQSVSASVTAPGSDVKFWIGNYQFIKYVPVWHGWTLSFLEGIDYGAPFGSTTGIPPYRQFFGGGPDNVRGFRESRLGPKDQFGNPYGGNMRITSQNELIFPMPSKYAQTARVSLFFDMGNIYQTGTKLKFFGPDGVSPEDYQFKGWNSLKRSVGVAVQWLAPLGLFRFSFGVPLNAKHGDGITTWGDETEGFQFSVGNAF